MKRSPRGPVSCSRSRTGGSWKRLRPGLLRRGLRSTASTLQAVGENGVKNFYFPKNGPYWSIPPEYHQERDRPNCSIAWVKGAAWWCRNGKALSAEQAGVQFGPGSIELCAYSPVNSTRASRKYAGLSSRRPGFESRPGHFQAPLVNRGQTPALLPTINFQGSRGSWS